jgi:polar amino acid transport system substrate-binding protein
VHRILTRKKIVVALIDTDYPPLFVSDKTGRLSGHDIDLVHHLASELGVDAVFNRQARSFEDVIDLVSKGEADIGIGTSITLPRAKKVLFSHPYMMLKMALFINRLKRIEAGIASELQDLAAIRQTSQAIGLLTGSAYKAYAQQTFPKATLTEYRSLTDLIIAVEQGTLLAAVRNDLTAKRYLHRHPAALLKLQLFVDEGTRDPIAFAVRPDSPHLLSWLNTLLLLQGNASPTREITP